ncbi:TonB-dependent receptor [Rhizomicrobium palustre]|uniref:TonB-dependent receptor n=1 Tax=Rhizomicrobium palustre TaxID=189966 RepID=A0A846MVU7_9PROT|nr:TonB-dependent receptor [Rhizomicrobium palustre]NIK87127.1 TonB-dependent receptor [Rhizomicrobium palustre]
MASSAAALFVLPSMAETADTSSETIETVRVVGTRQSADALQLRADSTISVLSSQDLEHTAVHNVAEALQLLPGINVTNTGNSFFGGIDGASRGEGMFAQVRGMNSEFTLNLINGVDVAQGMPYSREVQLSLLPPSGLQTIVVNKTGGADQELDFIGGSIDFRTPTAFDFSADQTFSATLGGRAETRAFDYKADGMGYSASVDGSKKFGAANQFGLYASAYFDQRHFVNSELAGKTEAGSDGQWAFVVSDADGNSPAGMNPAKNLTSIGFGVGISSGYTVRWGGNVAADWNVNSNVHVYGKASYAFAHTRQDTTFSQILATNVKRGSSGVRIGTTDLYQPLINDVSTRFWYETNPENANLGTAQLGTDVSLGKLSLDGKVYYTWGKNDRPNHVEISNRPLNEDGGGNGFAYGGTSLISYDSDAFPYATLTPAMAARLGNLGANPARRAGDMSFQHSGQEKAGVILDGSYAVDDEWLQSVKFGFKESTSWRHVDALYTETPNFGNTPQLSTVMFSDLGIYDSMWSQAYPGKYTWSVPKINQAKLIGLYQSKPTVIDSCDGRNYAGYGYGACDTQNGRETVTSAYAMATLKFGDVEAIPGLRYEHSEIHNVFWKDNFVTDKTTKKTNWVSGGFTSNNTSYDEVLPSLFLNWRPADGAVYRASVWTSYTRPAFIQLAANNRTQTNADGSTSITEGNPDLKPIESVNYELSGQWSSEHGGYLQASAFAKQLSNYIYNSGTNFVNGTSITTGNTADTSVTFTKPMNGGSGHIYGIELEFRQKLDEVSGWLGGFGLGGNFTHNWTKVDLGAKTGLNSEPVQNAPDNVANMQLFYEKDGLQFDLLWHYTGSYVASYDYLGKGASWDHVWVQPTQRVDLHVGYEISDALRGDVSVSNLMDTESYRAQVGQYSSALSDVVDTGRTILFTIKYKN